MKQLDTKYETLKNIGFFNQFREHHLMALSQNAHLKKLDKGQILFQTHDRANHFYVVRSGWVKLYRETIDGAQTVIDIVTQPQIFGDSAIFEDNIYPYSAEASEPVEILSIPISYLETEIEENPSFAKAMLASMARYRKHQSQEIEHRDLQNAPQRIGCFLLRLVEKNNSGRIEINLPYDKSLVAARLGMQPETFSRALKKLKSATGIVVNGSHVELDDITKLSEYSCVACSSDFPCKDKV